MKGIYYAFFTEEYVASIRPGADDPKKCKLCKATGHIVFPVKFPENPYLNYDKWIRCPRCGGATK